MFNKNNLKHIIILALGFFWCSGLYLTEQTYMLKYYDKNFVNVVALLYGSISMVLGISLFAFLFRKSKQIKMYYILFSIFSIISSFVFFGTNNKIIMSICMCLTCLFSTAGFGAGYHFSLVALNINKDYRGRIFSIGYGLDSILTYLLSLFSIKFYGSIHILFIYIPIIIINMILIYKNNRLDNIESKRIETNYKKTIIILSIIVLLMSLLSAISTDVVSTHIFNYEGLFINTRIYYCIGLLVSGLLIDKSKEIFDICTLTSFVFSLLAIILLNQNISSKIVIAISYFFIGFFVVFRTISFMNLTDSNKNIVWISAFGLMYSRIMEGLFIIFQNKLINNYTLLIIIESLMLCIVLWVYLLFYLKKNNEPKDKINELIVKYKLTGQEAKVLRLLLQDLTKKEIAQNLFLSVNTIKIHVTNIYKKTGMKKNELKEKCM